MISQLRVYLERPACLLQGYLQLARHAEVPSKEECQARIEDVVINLVPAQLGREQLEQVIGRLFGEDVAAARAAQQAAVPVPAPAAPTVQVSVRDDRLFWQKIDLPRGPR